MKPTFALLSILVSAACTDGAAGPPPGSRSLALNTVADGVSGTVLMTRETPARSTVSVTLRGVTPGVTYTGHVGRGSCRSPGADVVVLNTVAAASTVGSATTRSVPDSVLATGFHLYYARPGPPPSPVACGDLD